MKNRLKPGKPEMIRINNQNLIINEVLTNEPLSRADIAKKLKISAPAISSNIEKLISKGILKEIGAGESAGSTGGRKPILLSFNYDYKYVALVDLSREDMQLGIYSLDGEIVIDKKIVHDEKKITKEDIENIANCLNELLAEARISKDKIACINVATPGLIDHVTGYFIKAPRFEDYKNINIEKIFKRKYECMVLVENDTNLATMAELRYGSAKEYKNVLYISVGFGIGAGIIIDGKLHTGARLAAGEIGYWVSKNDSFLDYEISIFSIMKKIREINGEVKDIFDLKGKFQEDDPKYFLFLESIVRELSILILNTNALLDIEAVIIGGEIAHLADILIPRLHQHVDDRILFPVDIKKSQFNGNGIMRGLFVVAYDFAKKQLV